MNTTILTTVVLLVISNIFMTFAWYGHLKFKTSPLWIAIALSWSLALFEYCFQVPANRIGHTVLSAPQLKALQEGITFAVFTIFSIWYLKEHPTRWDFVAFFLIALGVCISVLQPSRGS
jgi:uncharacterized protein (DUF486 family)